jgi:hypothetical protein
MFSPERSISMIFNEGRAASSRVRPPIRRPVDQLPRRVLSPILDQFFSLPASCLVLFFGLPIIDRIESPTVVVITRLYSDLGVNFAPLDSPKLGHRGQLAGADSALYGSSCRLLYLPWEPAWPTQWR